MTDTPEKLVQTIRRKTRKKHRPEETIRIVLDQTRSWKIALFLPLLTVLVQS